MRNRWTLLPGCAAVLAAGVLALAAASPGQAADPRLDSRPTALRDVTFDQRVNALVPLDATFRDEAGRAVRLGDYVSKRPMILVLVYFRCQDLCPLLLEGAARSLQETNLTPGKDYNLVVLSFDPHDTPEVAAQKKAELARRYAPAGAAGWHFLTGEDAEIRRLTQAVGFHYTYDPARQEYAHAAGLVLVTPQGRIFRYLYGIDFSPQALRLGVVEASGNQVGTAVDQVLLFCYHYDPSAGKYSLAIINILRAAGVGTVGAMGAFIVLMWRRDRRQRRQPTEGA